MLKRLLFLVFILFSILILSGIGGYFYLDTQVSKLKNHYPVWNKVNKKYELVNKKPKHWVALSSISKKAKWAIILSEDWAFYDHEGLDYNQLKIVFEESYKAKKFVRGASTITQQVVKNSLLSNERSISRKIQEMLMAIMLEKKLNKQQILEIYLNLIELGKDIYGIKNASWAYFKKSPAKLTAREGAFLAMLLPSPVKYSQSFRDKKLTKFASEQVSSILLKMKQAKKITEEERLAAENEYLSFEDQPVAKSHIQRNNIDNSDYQKIKENVLSVEDIEFYEVD